MELQEQYDEFVVLFQELQTWPIFFNPEAPMREAEYQARLIKKLHYVFPGCIILKNDSGYMQGIPDLTIFYYDQYALLEVKAHKDAPQQPNQEHYVDMFNDMAFSAFIFPENEEEVLRELQFAFSTKQ